MFFEENIILFQRHRFNSGKYGFCKINSGFKSKLNFQMKNFIHIFIKFYSCTLKVYFSREKYYFASETRFEQWKRLVSKEKCVIASKNQVFQ